MASTKEIRYLYETVAKVKVTKDVEGNNTCNRIGHILKISSTERAYIDFDAGQDMNNNRWWVPFVFIQPVTVSFLDIK